MREDAGSLTFSQMGVSTSRGQVVGGSEASKAISAFLACVVVMCDSIKRQTSNVNSQ